MKESVLVVGSGITGLMSAFKAVEEGFDVTIISKSPDPRKFSESTTLFQSSTHDGSYNRYITSTEGHPYLDLEGYITKMYEDIAPDFEKTIQEGGMLALEQAAFEGETKAFLKDRLKVNKKIRANRETEKHYESLFENWVEENLMSMRWWYEYLTFSIRQKPELARELSLSLGIHRFYDTAELFAGASGSLEKHGILKKRYTVEEALEEEEFASYHEGIKKGLFVKGGALIMYGLAFNIKTIVRFLLDTLEELGVRFYFGDGYDVVEIEREGEKVSGLRTKNGDTFLAKHILFHGGAYTDPKLFSGTKAEAQIGGMKGFWINIHGELAKKIINGMGNPPKANKIHGGKIMITVNGKEYLSQVADLNIMPMKFIHEDGAEEYVLCIGSGYLFVGEYPFRGDLDVEDEGSFQHKETIKQGEKLAKAAFFEVVKRVYDLDLDFEDAYQDKYDEVEVIKKGCVRSWSVDDKELRVIEKTKGGGVMIIHGGGNTGDTTKSQFISRTAMRFLKDCPVKGMDSEELEQWYEKTRGEMRKGRKNLTPEVWQGLEKNLKEVWEKARQSL